MRSSSEYARRLQHRINVRLDKIFASHDVAWRRDLAHIKGEKPGLKWDWGPTGPMFTEIGFFKDGEQFDGLPG